MASDPCKQSEAMAKINKLVELPIVCEALLQARGCRFGLFLFIPSKADTIIVKEVRGKISPSFSEGRRWVKNPDYLIGGSILLSKGGSIQMGVEAKTVT